MNIEQMKIMKTTISLLKSTNRKGIDKLIQFLIDSQYFLLGIYDDMGDDSHSRIYDGALAAHALSTYQTLLKLNNTFQANLPQDSIIIVALLHDVCRIDKNNLFPTGHSEKSIFIIQKFIQLTNDEILAINAHMGFCDQRAFNQYDNFQKAYDISALSLFLFVADQLSSSYVEIANIKRNNLTNIF